MRSALLNPLPCDRSRAWTRTDVIDLTGSGGRGWWGVRF